MPYDVTVEQALKHEEVQQRIDQSIQYLMAATNKFLDAIFNSVNKIP